MEADSLAFDIRDTILGARHITMGITGSRYRRDIARAPGTITAPCWLSARICQGRNAIPGAKLSANRPGGDSGENIALKSSGSIIAPTTGDTV
jgi:hypothetical protein